MTDSNDDAARYRAWRRYERVGKPMGETGLVSVHARYGHADPDLSDCLAFRWDDARPWLLTIWQPLLTHAPCPDKATPHCCYIRTVIFYHRPNIVSPWGGYWRPRAGGPLRRSSVGGFVEWDEIETRLGWDDVVRFQGEAFEVHGGTVVWRRTDVGGRWWMRHNARRQAVARVAA